MKEIAILLRTMRIFTQIAHHSVTGVSFFADHKALEKFYEAHDDSYDELIERIIGLYGLEHLDLLEVQIIAIERLKMLPTKSNMNVDYFQTLLTLEEELCTLCTELLKHPALYAGTQDLISRIADDAEQRKFLIKARIK